MTEAKLKEKPYSSTFVPFIQNDFYFDEKARLLTTSSFKQLSNHYFATNIHFGSFCTNSSIRKVV